MQTVWTEWGRSAALPLLPPAPPQTRPLQIVDPVAFPALPLALAKASAGPCKREIADDSRPHLPRPALLPMDEGDEAEAAERLLPPRRRYYAGIGPAKKFRIFLKKLEHILHFLFPEISAEI